MSTAFVGIVIVVGLLVGVLLGLRNSAKTGMPTQDVLDRATQRERELEAREESRRDEDAH